MSAQRLAVIINAPLISHNDGHHIRYYFVHTCLLEEFYFAANRWIWLVVDWWYRATHAADCHLSVRKQLKALLPIRKVQIMSRIHPTSLYLNAYSWMVKGKHVISGFQIDLPLVSKQYNASNHRFLMQLLAIFSSELRRVAFCWVLTLAAPVNFYIMLYFCNLFSRLIDHEEHTNTSFDISVKGIAVDLQMPDWLMTDEVRIEGGPSAWIHHLSVDSTTFVQTSMLQVLTNLR